MTRVLAVNAGSSSLKLDVVETDDSVRRQEHLEDWDGETEPIANMIADAQPEAVGHRVVHGGATLTGPVTLNDDVVKKIRACWRARPLHQPRALSGIEAVSGAAPGLPSVACFDTVFHQTMPAAATTYAVPGEWRQRFGVRRFGFHGLSHAYGAQGRTDPPAGGVPASDRELSPGIRSLAVRHRRWTLGRHDDGHDPHGGFGDGNPAGFARPGHAPVVIA